jgi:hypothetical protein
VESATESYLSAAMAYHFGCNNCPDDLDQYVPAVKQRVEASGPKQWALLEGGNHVCNNMPFRYRPLVGDFLAKHLGAKSV